MEVMLARFTQETPETPMLRWGKAGARGGNPCGDFVGMFRRSFRLAAILIRIRNASTNMGSAAAADDDYDYY